MHPGIKIKRLRKQHKLTQEELGNMLGVKKAAIQKYEKGDIVNLKLATIRKLCEIFQVNPWEFVFPEAEEFDLKYNVKQLSFEVKTIEAVQQIYGDLTIKMMFAFNQLNDDAKNKVLEITEDYAQLDKYTR